MASTKKPTRAEQAVSEAKKKTSGGKSTAKTTKSNSKKETKSLVKTEYDQSRIPSNWVIAAISLLLFMAFVAISVSSEGWLLQFVEQIVLGLIGKVGFYFSIPALLYLFVINAFRNNTNVRMRSFCLVSFVLICGCISQLSVPERTFSQDLRIVIELFQGGIAGYTAGVICGGFALMFASAFGTAFSMIVLGLAGVLTLLGSIQITIPSLIRAFQNRPRDDWEEEDLEEEAVDPAALVVNAIVNKQIERKRMRRQQQELDAEEAQLYMEEFTEPAVPAASKRKNAPKMIPAETTVVYKETETVKIPSSGKSRAKDLLNQIADIGEPVAAAAVRVKDEEKKPVSNPVPKPVVVEEEPFIPETMPIYRKEDPIPDAPKMEEPVKPMPKDKVTTKEAETAAAQVAAEIEQAKQVMKPEYCFPPLNLLNPPMRGNSNGTDEMRENSRRLNETLQSFKIDAHIINVTRGPSVTRYEVELDKGVRFNKLTTHADDIALSLGAPSVRIAAVPGKISIVGIEVPNRSVTMVSLREVIDSPEFDKSKSKSSFAVGKDIGGSCIIGNIAKMPHMLIAGTTGSGKSVCMNSLIISLLYKAGPEDVKLIMVDPKMVELANYNGIPHLMIPVVTDPKKAAGALQWAVTEMMRRYKTMSDAGVRDLESYNSIVMSEGGEKVPQLIVIIDELADLMLSQSPTYPVHTISNPSIKLE